MTDPVTDLEARAERLVAAMAAEICEFRDPGSAHHPDRPFCAFSREMARAALNVVRAERSQITCPTCGGSGIWEADQGEGWETVHCNACNGSGSVPGELLVVGLIGERLSIPMTYDPDAPLIWATAEPVYRIIEREAPQ